MTLALTRAVIDSLNLQRCTDTLATLGGVIPSLQVQFFLLHFLVN